MANVGNLPHYVGFSGKVIGFPAENDPDNGGLSRKVVAIAAGEAHTLALTGDGSVYSWGRGTFGRLGTGSELDELHPVEIEFQVFDKSSERERVKIVSIAAGAYHSIALADDGTVWSWGYNTYGQLGVSGENSLVPCPLVQFHELGAPHSLTEETESEIKTPLKISSVKAGGMMSMAIDNHGALWMWGQCPPESSSVAGEFALVSSFHPNPVWNFHGHTVVKVACGNEHVVALVNAEETNRGGSLLCYSWGNNNHGQLGLGDNEIRLQPQVIEVFNLESPWAVYEVSCGAFHTALLAHKEGANGMLESMCWTFGLGDNGQLGHGTTKSALFPEPVNGLPENALLISVDCGLFHTSVVSSAGDVWSWGMEKGLGLCPDASFSGTDAGDAIAPVLISCNGMYGPKFAGPIQVACGAAHTVIVAEDGYKLWSWGRGRSGVLGNGKTEDCYAPSLVLWPPLKEEFVKGIAPAPKFEKGEEENEEGSSETGKEFLEAPEEIKMLRSKLSMFEQYAGILHGAIFGRPLDERDIPNSLRISGGSLGAAKEWENILESADHGKLIHLERFYRNMLGGVKDKLLKRRIQEIIAETQNSTIGN